MGGIKGKLEFVKWKTGGRLTRKGAMLAQCYACNGLDGSRVDCGGKLSCPMYEFSPYKPVPPQE